MIQFTHYYRQVQGLGGRWTGLPQWARAVVGIFALPAVVLAALSLLGFLISILVLLLLTLPVYTLLKWLTTPAINPANDAMSPGAKRVESTIVQ